MKPLIPIFTLPLTVIAYPVYAVQYFTPEQAQVALFGDKAKFTPSFVKMSDEQRDAIEDISDVRQRWKTQKVWKTYQNGQFQGWFIIDKVIGKHEFITYATAISPEGKVLGIEVMDYRETYGDQIRQASWREHFIGATDKSPLKLQEDIPNISGATLSCRNVTNGVKRLLALYEVMLKGQH
ncbi:FMN-binding protein [Hydrogenovibrio kuenenii]|uniref:FMN-binding protein n=1 Tax=Hydrogenovibrio kuenenii TaxID=63658 RepID=UPI0004658D91|nr:FMN-binding protein [Hydrogenovibrio kuenenii]